MNNVRRREIKNIIINLEGLRTTIENLQMEEESAMMAIEEKFSGTERFEKMEECDGLLGDAINNIEEAISNLEECIE